MIAWILTLLIAFATGASSATCPPSWAVATVRSTGLYACELARRENDPDRSPWPRVTGRVWCPPGSVAYTPTITSVGCWRSS